jgi:carbonic anhydrase
LGANQRRAQILSQSPFAIIVGCADSRVPTEIVYDQSLGSLFVIRVAGNIVEPATAGSVEYAVDHLKSRLIVVMGHEGCGAVAAAMLPDEARAKEGANVQFLLDQIRPAVSGVPELRDKKARMREAVIANVRRQTHLMKQNPTVAKAVEADKVRVVGAYYEIGSGAVDFVETEDELRISDAEAKQVADQIRSAMPPKKQ